MQSYIWPRDSMVHLHRLFSMVPMATLEVESSTLLAVVEATLILMVDPFSFRAVATTIRAQPEAHSFLVATPM